MKRDGRDLDGDQPPRKVQKAESGGITVRFLIPARAAGLIIGRGGENIKRIRTQCSVKLHIPDTRSTERVFTIEGDLDRICDVWRDIMPKIKDIISAKQSDPKLLMGQQRTQRRKRNHGTDDQQDNDEKEDSEDRMIDLRVLIHQSVAGFIIGKGGERIRDMRQKHQMRVIKVYQMLAPNSTDRVVQLIAEPENAIQCMQEIIEVAENTNIRGPVENYDASNFSEPDALTYGGWLSPEGLRALSQGMTIGGNMNNGPPGSMMSSGYGGGGNGTPNRYMGGGGGEPPSRGAPQSFHPPPPPGVYMSGRQQSHQFQQQSPQRGMPPMYQQQHQQQSQTQSQQFASRGGGIPPPPRPQQQWGPYHDGGYGNGNTGSSYSGYQQHQQPHPMPVAPPTMQQHQGQQPTNPMMGGVTMGYDQSSNVSVYAMGNPQLNAAGAGYNLPPQQQGPMTAGLQQPNAVGAAAALYRMNAPPPQMLNSNSSLGSSTNPLAAGGVGAPQIYGVPPPTVGSGGGGTSLPPPYGYSMGGPGGAPGPVQAPTVATPSVLGTGGVPTTGVYPPGGPW
ncbi:hypothetical protein Aperf_G00000106822 [Anoplocephala perfoliata]